MTMRVTRITDAEPFSPSATRASARFACRAATSTPTTDFTVVLSHYLPGGAAELAPQVAETVYVVLSGALVMISEGEEATLEPLDSVHFTPGHDAHGREPDQPARQHARHPGHGLNSAEPEKSQRHRTESTVTSRTAMSGTNRTAGSALHHQPAHRSVPGDFNATLATFAAMALYDHLDGEQRARVVVPLDDDNRTHWNFLPESGRRGVPIRDMSQTQRYLAHRLIAQCMSVEGYAQVVQVMSLEHVLRELNEPVFGHVAAHFRDPEGYFLTFFNQPQPDSDWGWRLVGHHLSLNFTVAGQDLLASTPLLLGSEPARFGPVPDPRQRGGPRLLAAGDARRHSRRRPRRSTRRRPPDFASRCVPILGAGGVAGRARRRPAGRRHHRRGPRGAALDQESAAGGWPRGADGNRAAGGLRRVAGVVRPAAQAGAGRPGDGPDPRRPVRTTCTSSGPGRTAIDEPHYFRIEGPVTLIEFDNTEDNANHVHCVWRDPENDFGFDILARHRAAQHGSTRLESTRHRSRQGPSPWVIPLRPTRATGSWRRSSTRRARSRGWARSRCRSGTPGTTLVAVVAAPLNPLDLLIASGTFHSARHEAAYVPGSECVGVVVESDRYAPGTWVYAECHAVAGHPGRVRRPRCSSPTTTCCRCPTASTRCWPRRSATPASRRTCR